jgi:hypothetical protein
MIEAARELMAAQESLVRAILIPQLRGFALVRFELDGNLLLIKQVDALEDDAKGALANLLANAVTNANDVRKGAGVRHRECGDGLQVQQLEVQLDDIGELRHGERWRFKSVPSTRLGL